MITLLPDFLSEPGTPKAEPGSFPQAQCIDVRARRRNAKSGESMARRAWLPCIDCIAFE